ncbi:MAG: site-2 protease family protein [Moorea sp. SIO1F2]|uniref:site-2 protease family protein n=1 Tax=Moorena sp. SIO1F2 TaxID=2607819 RepID=UPI0013B7B295|nr:site-2 protease family protein [Moorena sp. SIO1F2]NET83313.1 site-2 protease family protein [Moorena sp. SIO1F2]
MFNGSQTTVTLVIILVALGVLGWGYNRARSYGKLGILAWLQSVVLTLPWLLFFGLVSMGIYLNIVGILFLLLASTGLYIYLGRLLRAAGQDEVWRERATKLFEDQQQSKDAQKSEEQDSAAYNNLTAVSEGPNTTRIGVATIPDEDLQLIKEIFGIDTFFATETIKYQEGAIFTGNLRGNDAEVVHSRLSANLKEKLSDRYRLFLVDNPEGKPVVIVLPSTNDPRTTTVAQKILALVLVIATFFTTLEVSGLLLEFDLFSEPERFREALPITIGIWIVLITHELGHWWQAKAHDVRLSIPFFLPSLQIGSFGAMVRFESLLPNRKVLFDISIAGPAVGGVVSLVMLMAGLFLSHQGSAFQVPAEFFQASILVGGLAKLVLGSALQESLVDVHPLTIVGWLGLTITALNLMPAGQLDGGRIVQAIYGRKTARLTTIATLVILGILALINPANPIILYWGILILFLQRSLERPSLNEITELDDTRALWGLLALFLMVATLIPINSALAGRLGIGG